MYLVHGNSDAVILKKLPKSYSSGSLASVIDSFGSVQDFSIGTSPPKFVPLSKAESLKEELVIKVEHSFCGQIKKFYLLKKDLTENEMEDIAKKMKARSENTDIQNDSSFAIKKSKKGGLFSSKAEEVMDYEQFESQALLNLSAFPVLNKTSVEEENQWVDIVKKDDKIAHSIISVLDNLEKNKKSRLLLFDRKPEKKHEIRANGVSYFEKSRFEDVLFSIGNLEIILYAFDLLNNFDQTKFENTHRHKILCEIIEIIQVLCKSSNKEDVVIFLNQQNGFHYIARLLKLVRLIAMKMY